MSSVAGAASVSNRETEKGAQKKVLDVISTFYLMQNDRLLQRFSRFTSIMVRLRLVVRSAVHYFWNTQFSGDFLHCLWKGISTQ